MKILFLSGDGCTEHMADFLYNGFVELYGQENVIDYPYKPRYHVKDLYGNMDAYTYWCSCIDKGTDNRTHYTFDEIVQMVNNKQFDLLVTSVRAYDTFVQIKNHTWPIGTIVINGEDMSDDHYLRYLLPKFTPYWKNVDMILQREYKHNIPFDRKVVPFPCPCPDRNLPNFDFKKDKEIDLFCHLGDTHPFRKKLREKVMQISQKLGIKSLTGNNHFSIYEYFRLMNNSKICIMSGGVGWETTHYLDIPFAKSMLLAQHPENALHPVTLKKEPIVYPNNFKDRRSAVFYKNSLSNLEDTIIYYLEHDKEREEITRRGYEHLTNNLTAKHIAEYVINCRFNLDHWKSLM